MGRKKIIILGAGLSGLSAAWHLQRKGIDCRVYERESEVGGLCRSKTINGFTFDYDGHLLHFKHRPSFNLVKSLLGNNLIRHERSAWIYSYDRYIHYPFQANLYGLPLPITKECLLGFIQASKDNHKNKGSVNFLCWINRTFGKAIAKHFMIPYNTKFWTLPPQELTCEWLDNFIPVPSLDQVIEGTIAESKRQFGYNAQFWYPERGGINRLPVALATSIKGIYTNCKILEIDLGRKEAKTASGDKEKFDYLISTIPLPEMRYLTKGIPVEVASMFRKLRWNSIFNLNLGIDRKDKFARHWVYFPQEKFCFFRVGFPHNFSSSLVPLNKSSLYIEVAYSKNRPIDKSKIVLQIKEQLRTVGILAKHDRICAQDINDIKYAYPIYDINYNQARKAILKYLSHKGILTCGRFGSWRYMCMEESMLDGMKIASILLKVPKTGYL
jgi:protoporphyrinogen oxidase